MTYIVIFLLVDSVIAWAKVHALRDRVSRLERRLNGPIEVSPSPPSVSAVDLMRRN